MNEKYATHDEPATRDYVFAVLTDLRRQDEDYDPEFETGAEITLESTVAEWRLAHDLVECRLLGRSMNEWWQIEIPDETWQAVLEPADVRTVAEVCDLIASHASMPFIRPATILGKACRPAAAFLTIRSILNDAGVDAASIGPSTPLHEYTRRHWEAFLGPIARLAPGALPKVRIDAPFEGIILLCAVISMLMIVVGICVLMLTPWVLILSIVMFAVFWLLAYLTCRATPASVQFGELRTFRDLAILIADRAPMPPART